MPLRRPLAVAASLAAVLAGCGGDSGGSASPARLATPSTSSRPALARRPVEEGEVLFSGEASPASHGPFTLRGHYVVRFEQIAPEDPKLDFSDQTPFTALLRRAGSTSPATKLFGSARASGKTVIGEQGRYELEVTFGDFPYAVRFTPST
jgi:hypothetical protein